MPSQPYIPNIPHPREGRSMVVGHVPVVHMYSFLWICHIGMTVHTPAFYKYLQVYTYIILKETSYAHPTSLSTSGNRTQQGMAWLLHYYIILIGINLLSIYPYFLFMWLKKSSQINVCHIHVLYTSKSEILTPDIFSSDNQVSNTLKQVIYMEPTPFSSVTHQKVPISYMH